MNWTLFIISVGLWIFFSEHFIWLKRFESMAEHGIQIPTPVTSISKTLAMITMFNLVIFLFVYGFKVNWLWSVVIVFGGYATGLAYVFLTRDIRSTLIHKIGWAGMPILSIAIWISAFVA